MKIYMVRDIYDDEFYFFSSPLFAAAWIDEQEDPLAWFYDEFEVIL